LIAAACGPVGSAPRLVKRDVRARGLPTAIAFWDQHVGLMGGSPASLGLHRTTCRARCRGAVAVTPDGGVRWNVTLTTRLPIRSIDVARGTLDAWVTAGRCSSAKCTVRIYSTVDLGRTWRPLPAWPVRDPVFVSDLVGWGLPRSAPA